MLTTFKANAKKLSEGLQVATESRNFKVLIDEPIKLGGTNKAMSPVELLLCALGGCQAIVAAAFAKSQHIKFEEFHVEIEGDIDLDGFMGLTDVRSGFQEIRFTMHFKTDESQEKMEKFSEFIEKHCPIGDTIANKVRVVKSGVVID